jgi:HAD superfamily hydrolase (TIGR01484 family)
MNYRALATDYDGTLAHDGVVEESMVAALQRFRQTGRNLIMVTGREVGELLEVFGHCDLFDWIVAENGALLYHPAMQTWRSLAPPPPPQLIEILQKKGVPFSVGRSILATVEPHEHAVLDAIRELGLEWHVIFNKGSVMVLPSGITKATGLVPALQELGIAPAQTVAVGDAENDHAFMRLCGRSVAVANALESVKADADLTTVGARGAGVAELIDRIIANDLADVAAKPAAHRQASSSP